jgi:hypothetical protein
MYKIDCELCGQVKSISAFILLNYIFAGTEMAVAGSSKKKASKANSSQENDFEV